METEDVIKKYEMIKNQTPFLKGLETFLKNGNPIGKIETIKTIKNNLEKIIKLIF
jgi:hypothetical protein